MSKTIEILKFLRVTPEKKRLIQVRGRLFTNVDDIPDERVQKVVRQSIAEMVLMAGGYEKLINEGFLEPTKTHFTDPKPLADTDINELLAENKVDQKLGAPKSEDSTLPSTTVNFESKPQNEPILNPNETSQGSLLSRFRNLTGRTPSKPQSSILSLDIAGQINEILQQRLEEDRSFAGRQIELRSARGGDLQFVVDGRFYESVNDIPEESTATLFRNAITEWESG